MHPAIDIHSHMLCEEWLDLIRAHGGPKFSVAQAADGRTWIHLDGVRFMFPQPEMFDYGQRLAAMDAAGVDMAVLSLTGPNVYWGGEAVSTRAARVMNDSFAAAQAARTSTTAAVPISWSRGIRSTVRRSREKWIGASRCVPPCSEVRKRFAA